VPDWLLAGLAGLLALLAAGVMSVIQLLTSKYPNTYFLFTPRKSPAFYVYCFVLYGGVAFAVTLALDYLITQDVITIEGLNLESPWWRAVIVGLIAKALIQISFFDVTAGARTVPIGPALVVQPLEPWLLTKIQQDEDNELRTFVQSRANKYSDSKEDLKAVRKAIKDAPHSLPHPEHIAFELEIDDAETVEKAMEKHVRILGKKSFNTAFPT